MTSARTAKRTRSSAVPLDERTVGELLLAADLAARDALWDSGRIVAKQRLASWIDVIDAATGLWASIPDRTANPAMGRIDRIARGISKTSATLGWPPTGAPADPHLASVAADLRRAAELVAARRHPTARLSDAGHQDSEAARTRLMHVVNVATHGMRWSLDRYVRDLRRLREARHPVPAGDSLAASRDLLRRTAPVELIALDYLRRRWPVSLDGEHRDPVPNRLDQAMAGWEIQVRRALVKGPTAANLLFAASVERQGVLAAEFVLGAATTLGLVDREDFAERTRPALASLGRAWGRLERDLAPLSGWRRADPDLAHAADELRAGLREITHDGAALASPQVMVDRTDLVDTSRRLQLGAALGAEVGHLMGEAIDEIEWTVPARGAREVYRALGVAVPQIDSRAVREGGAVALTREGAEALAEHVGAVVRVAGSLDSAGMRAPVGGHGGVGHREPATGPGLGQGPAVPLCPTF